ncbi:MAG: glycosyltransferase family 4 protein [Minisyncoccota bacterium]
MTNVKQTVAIDIRLLGKKRTGDEMVFFHLTKEVIKLNTETTDYHLLTDRVDTAQRRALAERLECSDNSAVQIVSLKAQNRFIWNIWVLPLYLWRQRIDVLHTQYIIPFFYPKHTKIVVHIHDISFRVYPELIRWTDRLFLYLLIPRSLRRAKRILTPSQFTKNEIIHWYHIAPQKIAVIPNAVGEEFMRSTSLVPEAVVALKTKYHLPKRFLIVVGTLQPRKNIPFLITAFANFQIKIGQSHPQCADIGLVIVGNPQAHHTDPRIREVIHEYHLESLIHFPGFIETPDLPHVIGMAEALVFPSLYEGFGIPLLEAMSQGVPIISSNIASLREVADDAALYFDPQSLARCTEILYTLFINPKQREELIRCGKKRLQFFSWTKSAILLSNEYHSLI